MAAQRANLEMLLTVSIIIPAYNAEATLAALAVAVEERSASRSALSMKINPAYDFVRDDPRFTTLLRNAGLAE